MIQVSPENFQKQQLVTQEINRLLKNVMNDTGMFSTSNHIFEHEDFKTLVKMGDRIVPYLFYLSMQYGFDMVIFHLVGQITGEHPIPREHLGSFPHAIIYWMQWYLASKYKDHDIYYGLVNE